MKTLLMAGLALIAAPALALAQSGPRPGEVEIEFTPGNGDPVTAYQGHFEVPEYRADPNTRMIELGYVRFPATTNNPGSPIIYLSGGPGGTGTGTARGPRFPLFMDMRQHADVYAFDQRGTGLSDNDIPVCVSSVAETVAQAVTDAEWAVSRQRAAVECAAFWADQGIDLRGYTTMESVHDLSDLRRHLGADRISLWGISYGSHLALAALNTIDAELDRVIIASAEGLDQTVKLPSRTAAYFQRLQDAINAQPAVAAAYPDVVGLMHRVHDRLDEAPVLLDIPQADGSTTAFMLQRRDVQALAGGALADPTNVGLVLALYSELDRGEYVIMTALIQRFMEIRETIDFRAMPLAMDRASGITEERLALFNAQLRQSPIGAFLNAPMPQLLPVLTELDLGNNFRTQLSGETPVLLLTGTLDGRTYIEGQAEAVQGLSNVTQIMIHNAGHNLFMLSPDIQSVMHAFMQDEAVADSDIWLDAPDFLANPFAQ